MTSATAPQATAALSLPGTAWIFARHLTSFAFPVLALAFVWTGPHAWYVAPLFLAPMVGIFALDTRSHYEQRQPVEGLPAWPFDALVYVLAGLQFLVVFELCRMYQHQAIFSIDTVLVFVLVGGSSGFSIITAHELIHRKKRWEVRLGRLLLCTVLYEHFYTEHLRGHHVRVGTAEDPATARFGETYGQFFRRTVPAQFRSAWKLEARRLGDEGMSLFDPRMLRNRILHGIIVGWSFALAAGFAFGFTGFFAFVLQAFNAIALLEAVNYFEHWGLVRRQARVRPTDSWDTHSWFTYYGLTGLSRHADHHAWPARPFQQLRVWEEAPLLPAGYVGTVDMVMGRNGEFRHRATLELARRELGPFDTRVDQDPELQAQAAEALDRARAFQTALDQGQRPAESVRAAARVAGAEASSRPGWSAALPPRVRGLLIAFGLVAALSVGAWLEAGAGTGLAVLLAMNLWILAVFVGVWTLRVAIEQRGLVALSWVAFFALVAGIGSLTQTLLA